MVPGHSSYHSASLIPSAPPAPSGPSAEDVKRVISEYESRKTIKDDSAKSDKDSKDKEKEKASATPPATASPIPVATPAATHRKFALHRQIFDMRRNEIKRKEMGMRAKEVGKGLPQVPRGF